MLAGVGGIDLVLFIIAADESIKPQTREHFDICRMLRIPSGVVAITKTDLVDTDIVELVKLEAEEFVRGSFLEGAPILGVSAVTGAGLDELKHTLRASAERARPKDSARWFRMPIDRAFTMRGFGTVVTGTLISGTVSLEQEVEIHPERRRVRVRGVQVHGKQVEQAFAGQRTALNLAGVEVAEIARGMVLTERGRFTSTHVIDSRFELLAGARPLKHGAPVHLHAGAAEVEAQFRLLRDAGSMKPGETAYARFVLHDPLLILPGDRFIVRMFSPVETIGGGEVLDIDAPLRIKRSAAADRLQRLDGAPPADRIATLVAESPYGLPESQLIARTGLSSRDIQTAAARSFTIREPQLWLLDSAAAAQFTQTLQSAVQTFHRQNPLAPGIPKEDLRARVLPDSPPFLLDALLQSTKTLALDRELVRSASHRVAFREDEQAALAKIETAFANNGLAVPSTAEVLAKSGVESARAKSLLQILLRERKLVRIGDDLVFHSQAIHALHTLLAQRKGQRFSVADFKEWTGVSRKYAIPLLEYLDRERITRRDGDSRLIL
jgi:selenocysteine-specific elongation factor